MSGKETVMPEFDREEQKAIIKEAFREWLDEKYLQFGKWSFTRLGTLALTAFVLYLVAHGFIK
jgi:hypothetical protein